MDETENLRRARIAEINAGASERAELEARYGQVWDTQQLQEDFVVKGFMAPFCIVTRKSDDKVGSLEFMARPDKPRLYFNWQED